MHPNSIYRNQEETEALALAAGRGFGVVSAQLESLFGAHVPFILNGSDQLHLHLHRGNPLAKAASAQPTPVMLIVSLCDAYVSPDWYSARTPSDEDAQGTSAPYRLADQVPTWIYGAVHIYRMLNALPDNALEPMLATLSKEFETRLAPKKPWTLDKMSEKAKLGLMRAIQPFELSIERVESTDKFAQNKPIEALESLANQIDQSFGANLDAVEARVRHHVQETQA